ncbi:MAG: benzil reductase ((S)-benzoin forming) [Gammaproteobacteria bacterium]|jgi:benzil reductase ((S)-benzoin forming)
MRKVVVTGHSQGLGLALAQCLLDQEVEVLAISRSSNAELGQRYPEQLRQVTIDLSRLDELTDWLASDVLARFAVGASQLALINNAGQVQPIAALGEQDNADIAMAVNLNVSAPLMLANEFERVTRAVADRRVLHVSSGAARSAYAGWSVYCATKAALDHHARCVALDAPAGLKIASLAPGVLDTAMQARIRASTDEQFPLRARFEAMKRDGELGQAAVVATKLVAYLFAATFGDDQATEINKVSTA